MSGTVRHMQPWHRLVVLGLVVAAVGGMGVHYDSQFADQWPYTTDDELGSEYQLHVGTETFLTGTVERVDSERSTARISIEADAGRYQVELQSFDASVSQGGVVQVVGTVRPEHVVVVERSAVVSPAGSSELYKYVVSLAGAALVMVLFFRHWRVNTDTLALEARTDG